MFDVSLGNFLTSSCHLTELCAGINMYADRHRSVTIRKYHTGQLADQPARQRPKGSTDDWYYCSTQSCAQLSGTCLSTCRTKRRQCSVDRFLKRGLIRVP